MAEFTKIEELEEAIANDPTNFQARRELSVALLDKGFNQDALKHINYLIGIFPEDARLHYNQAIVFEKLKKDSLAEKSYKKAIELDGRQSDFLYNLGYLYLQNKRYDEALELFWQVLDIEKDDPNVYFNIGFLLAKKQEHQKAIQFFLKSYEMNNADVLSLFYTAREYSFLNDINQAKNYYLQVLDQCPDYSWAYFNLSVIEYNNNNPTEAFSLLQHTLKYNPKDIGAYKFGAKILVEANNLDGAKSFIEEGLTNCENDANLYYTLAQIYKLKNDKKNYVDTLKLALSNQITLDFPAEKIKNELASFIKNKKS